MGLSIACSLGSSATKIGADTPIPEPTPTLATNTPQVEPTLSLTPTSFPIEPATDPPACTDQFSTFQRLYEEKEGQGFDLRQVDALLERYKNVCRDQNLPEAEEILGMAMKALEQMRDSSSLSGVPEESLTITPTLSVPATPPATPASLLAPAGRQKIVPPEEGVYLGAYNFEGTGLLNFEEAIGKKVAITGYTPDIKNNGGIENSLPSFDIEGNERWYQKGYLTTYSLETGLGFPDPTFTPQDIIEGRLDNELRQVAQDIARWGRPIFWLYPREPDIQPHIPKAARPGFFHGGGYGPDGLQTGAEIEQMYGEPALYNSYQSPTGTSCDTLGDPFCLDGPERYRDMVRHIHDLVTPIAPNVTWVMGAITQFEIGDYRWWYPGNAYVDWHAIDEYQVVDDPGEPGQPAPTPHFGRSIRSRIDAAMELDPAKPVMILELGGIVHTGSNKDRSQLFHELFQSLKQDYPQVKAFLYFQQGEVTLTKDDPTAAVWRAEMNGPDADWWLSDVQTIPIP
jgi:hypothetical protein